MSAGTDKIKQIINQIDEYTDKIKSEINSPLTKKALAIKGIKLDIFNNIVRRLKTELEDDNLPNKQYMNKIINECCHEIFDYLFHTDDDHWERRRLKLAGYQSKSIMFSYDDDQASFARKILLSGGVDMGFFHIKESRSKILVNKLMEAAPDEECALSRNQSLG